MGRQLLHIMQAVKDKLTYIMNREAGLETCTQLEMFCQMNE